MKKLEVAACGRSQGSLNSDVTPHTCCGVAEPGDLLNKLRGDCGSLLL